MAVDVDVDVSDIAIISALNTPGGGVFRWRDDTATDIIRIAMMRSPVNDVFDALHRGGIVGTYIRAWGYDRTGSNGHRVRATIYNGAAHADIVEFGRRRSHKEETFAWRYHVPAGAIDVHQHGTSARMLAAHVLRNAVNLHGLNTGDYAPSP